MVRTKLCVRLAAIAVCGGLLNVAAVAQQPDPKTKKSSAAPARPSAAADQLVVRVYNVADLVLATPNYPYRSTTIPTIGGGAVPNFSAPSMGGGGGMGSGGLGGFGFSSAPLPEQAKVEESVAQPSAISGSGSIAETRPGALAQFGGGGGMAAPGGQPGKAMPGQAGGAESHESTGSARFDIETLQEALEATVDPETWNSVGGQGVCKPLGTLLVIRQTPGTHERIVEFLSEVRQSGGSLRPVTVVAYWLSLDAKGLADLVGAAKAPAAIAGQPVNRAALDRVASEAKTVSGQVTCFDGQTVHIISGQGNTISTGLNPVVAQGAVAFDPQLTTFHTGAMLQVTPTLSATDSHVVLDLQSTFSVWQKSDDPIEVQGQVGPIGGGGKDTGLATARLDRLKILAQQLFTTLRAPLGQPVLVGGMTMEPGMENSSHLYLVVEATAVDAAAGDRLMPTPMPMPMPPSTPQKTPKK